MIKPKKKSERNLKQNNNMVVTRSMTRAGRQPMPYTFPSLTLSDILYQAISKNNVPKSHQIPLERDVYDALSLFNIIMWDLGFPSSYKVPPEDFPKLYKRRPIFKIPSFCQMENKTQPAVHQHDHIISLGSNARDRIECICTAKNDYQLDSHSPPPYNVWRGHVNQTLLDLEVD